MTAHSAARRQHMQQRARERFGLEIGKTARRVLIRKIQTGDVKFARKLTHSRTVVVTEYAGIDVTFIYCGRTKAILTFLPVDARETAGWREGQRAAIPALLQAPIQAPIQSPIQTRVQSIAQCSASGMRLEGS